MSGNDSNESSSVHVFVRDPRILFVSPSTSLRYVRKEGEDLTLPCLLTDPDATDFTFRMDNGSAVPYGMNVTFDPKKGVLIHNVQPGFNADYVCSARIRGVEKVSKIFSINIIQRLRFPPYVFLKRSEYVKLVGERFQISCTTNNPNFYYNVTWTHSSRTVRHKSTMEEDRLAIESILVVPAVQLSDSGNITCTGQNEAGANSSTTHLLVVDEPYIRLSPKLSSKLTHRGLSIEISEGEDVDLRVLIEAYPPLISHQWVTPTSHNASLPENRFYNYNDRYEALMFLKRLNFQETGRYTLHVKSSRKNASITFDIKMYTKPVATVRWENVTTLSCRSYGYPAPSILWYQCTGIRTTHFNQTIFLNVLITSKTQIVLTVGPSNQRMTVVCVAFNLVGQGSDTFAMDVSADLPDQLFTSAMCGSIVAMVVLALLLIFMIYKYKQKPRYEIRWKIIEATNGNNYTFIDPTQLPYNEKWEFPRDKLKLGKTLGAGAFGKVVEATAYGLGKEDNATRVAVKMLKASAHPDEREALMSELKILSHLGQHKNIVNLLGACTHGGPVLVITEYCCHGDLLNFLRSKAENFLNFVMMIPNPAMDYKNINTERIDSGISSTCSDNYLAMRPASSRPTNSVQSSSLDCEQAEDSWPLDMDDLLRFSYQVAQGLDFLTAKNCIHRDVAARNVLLTNSRVAKICDFGLARDIMNDSNYVVKGNARLPVKWMAPESIFDCVYTVQSDVWSYGILLWEIFSLGKSPYPNILVDSKFYKMIKCGYQMSRPDFAPPEMYTIMKMCWNLEAAERPTFSKISQLIERMLGDTEDQQYKNVQSNAHDDQQLESCDPVKHEEESFETSCDQEEEDQPLMKPNNYQFC
uniref:receptor protein-tyrosine kinase n=1 Tax=Sinocyclocheilus grahami TaxID=75366 RepID=A0A672SU31_SINGR